MGRQIIDHNADITATAIQHVRGTTAGPERGVDPCQDTLPGRLLVSRGAVNLPGKKQPWYRPQFQSGRQRPGIDEIILDRITWTHNLRPRQTRNGGNQERLYVCRKAC